MNRYEPAEVIEVGKAQELILGVKEQPKDDNVGMPEDRYPAAFAQFDE